MSEVAFHFNLPDKLAYTCRLLRKATGAGRKVVVVAPAALLPRLDQALWTFSQLDFVTHCRADAPEPMRTLSAVLLADAVPEALPHQQVLVNLGDDVPAGFERFERVIELVSLDEADRQLARQRWKQYQAQGQTIVRHDVNVKPGA